MLLATDSTWNAQHFHSVPVSLPAIETEYLQFDNSAM